MWLELTPAVGDAFLTVPASSRLHTVAFYERRCSRC